MINGKPLTREIIGKAARALEGAIEPPSDLHAPAAYRRALAGTLLERALERTL
jgi:carbon-monoxide dehydrogenase medium subunit